MDSDDYKLADLAKSLRTSQLLRKLRTVRLLEQAPAMAAHVLTQVQRSGGAGGERVDGGGDESPLPMNANALEDANNLYAQLVNWTVIHARELGVMPPASVLGWSRVDTDCDGFPSWATRADARTLVSAVSTWLVAATDRIELGGERGIEARRRVDLYYGDVKEMMTPLLGRYPTAAPPVNFATRSCPVCGRRAVIVDFDDRLPAVDEKGEAGAEVVHVTVACTVCGHVIPSAAYEKYLPAAAVVG